MDNISRFGEYTQFQKKNFKANIKSNVHVKTLGSNVEELTAKKIVDTYFNYNQIFTLNLGNADPGQNFFESQPHWYNVSAN